MRPSFCVEHGGESKQGQVLINLIHYMFPFICTQCTLMGHVICTIRMHHYSGLHVMYVALRPSNS